MDEAKSDGGDEDPGDTGEDIDAGVTEQPAGRVGHGEGKEAGYGDDKNDAGQHQIIAERGALTGDAFASVHDHAADRAGSGEERDGQRHDGEAAIGGTRSAEVAARGAKDHFQGDEKDDDAPGDGEGADADAEQLEDDMPEGESDPEDDGDGNRGGAGDGQALRGGQTLRARQVDRDTFERINQNEDGDENFEVFGEVFHGED